MLSYPLTQTRRNLSTVHNHLRKWPSAVAELQQDALVLPGVLGRRLLVWGRIGVGGRLSFRSEREKGVTGGVLV